MAMSIGHSSSAYSLLWVMPRGSVTAAATMISCQPQKWIAESASLNMRRLQQALHRVVDAAKMALPAKAKMTAFVCSGRSRPKVR
jgi:hypothetical protein